MSVSWLNMLTNFQGQSVYIAQHTFQFELLHLIKIQLYCFPSLEKLHNKPQIPVYCKFTDWKVSGYCVQSIAFSMQVLYICNVGSQFIETMKRITFEKVMGYLREISSEIASTAYCFAVLGCPGELACFLLSIRFWCRLGCSSTRAFYPAHVLQETFMFQWN